MAPGGNSLSGRVRVSRRGFVKGLGAAAAVFPGLTMLPRWSLAEDDTAIYAKAAIDWKQCAGQTITLAGAAHPWSNAIASLLPNFTKLTGINVVTDLKARSWAPYRSSSPVAVARPTSSCS